MTTGNDQFEREFEEFLAEERSRVAEIYRKLPRPEPDARLDSAVRAMAHRALNPQLVATPRGESRRRRTARWIPALGAAAGVVLAAGIAWRMGPSLNGRDDVAPSREDVISVRAIDAPATAMPPLSPPPPAAKAAAEADAAISASGTQSHVPAPAAAAAPALQKPVPKAAPDDDKRPMARNEVRAFPPPVRAEPPAAPSAAIGDLGKSAEKVQPQAFAPPPQRKRSNSAAEAVERRQTMAEGAWQNLHDRDTRDEAKTESAATRAKTAAPAAAPAAPAQAPASALAAPPPPPPEEPDQGSPALAKPMSPRVEREEPAPAGEAVAGRSDNELRAQRAEGAPEQSSRPASSDPNARLYPEHWLENIRSMLRAGRRDEALRSLGEFRRMYPDYRLPDDLRDVK